MYSWVVNKNYIKTFFCEDGNNSHSAKHEIYNLTWFTRKNCRISKLFSVMNKHWPRPYWNTLEHISAHHTLGVLAHNVQRLQITDLRPKTTHGAWGLSFYHRIKTDVAPKRPWQGVLVLLQNLKTVLNYFETVLMTVLLSCCCFILKIWEAKKIPQLYKNSNGNDNCLTLNKMNTPKIGITCTRMCHFNNSERVGSKLY